MPNTPNNYFDPNNPNPQSGGNQNYQTYNPYSPQSSNVASNGDVQQGQINPPSGTQPGGYYQNIQNQVSQNPYFQIHTQDQLQPQQQANSQQTVINQTKNHFFHSMHWEIF
jgi:hypothetical protein